jgi:hypothetical protein
MLYKWVLIAQWQIVWSIFSRIAGGPSPAAGAFADFCRASLKLIAVDLLILTCRRAFWPTPGQFTRIAEKSLEDARKAFDAFIAAAQKAAAEIEEQATLAQTGAKHVGKKAMEFAERNVATSFEFVQKLARAKTDRYQ